MDSLRELYHSASDARPLDIKELVVGTACVACYTGDGDWYRAKIVSVDNNVVEVKLTDYGNTDSLPASELRRMTERSDVRDMKALSFECSLVGWTDKADQTSDDVVEQFASLTDGKKMIAEIISKTEASSFVVRLLDMGLDIGTKLSVGDQPSGDVKVENTNQSDAAEELSFLDTSATNEVTPVLQLFLADDKSESIAEKLNSCKLELHKKYSSRVKSISNHRRFFVELENFSNQVEMILAELTAWYHDGVAAKVDESEEPLLPGFICAANFQMSVVNEDVLADEYHRAVVVNALQDNCYLVRCVDTGRTATVSRRDIQPLKSPFASLPCQAIECALAGIEVSSEVERNLEFTDHFKALVDGKSLITEVVGVDMNGRYLVQLLDMGLSINDRLVEEHLAVKMVDSTVNRYVHLLM